MSGTLKIGGKTLATHNTTTNIAKLQLGSANDVVLADSAGNSVLSESGGTVTLAHDIVNGNSSYGFCRLELTDNQTSTGNITWNDPVGDTTNFTRSGVDITLGLSGVYLIIFNATCAGSDSERATSVIISRSNGTQLARSLDQISYLESNESYGFASCSYVGHFTANDSIRFSFSSFANANVDLDNDSHASIVLLRRTA